MKRDGVEWHTIINQYHFAWILKHPVLTSMSHGVESPWVCRTIPHALCSMVGEPVFRNRKKPSTPSSPLFHWWCTQAQWTNRIDTRDALLRYMSRDTIENVGEVVDNIRKTIRTKMAKARDTPARARSCRWVRAQEFILALRSAWACFDCDTRSCRVSCPHVTPHLSHYPPPISSFTRKCSEEGNLIHWSNTKAEEDMECIKTLEFRKVPTNIESVPQFENLTPVCRTCN